MMTESHVKMIPFVAVISSGRALPPELALLPESGGPPELSYESGYRVVHDLGGLRPLDGPIPLLLDHRPWELVGVVVDVRVTEGRLTAFGGFEAGGRAARAVLASLSRANRCPMPQHLDGDGTGDGESTGDGTTDGGAEPIDFDLVVGGCRWKCSIGAAFASASWETVPAGRWAVVNNRELPGPLLICREWTLAEVSLTEDPGDDQTGFIVLESPDHPVPTVAAESVREPGR